MFWLRLAMVVATPLALALGISMGLQGPSGPVPVAMGVGYTRHFSQPSQTVVIRVGVAGRFSRQDQAQIQSAMDQWNIVLNGHMRFDMGVPEPDHGVPVVAVNSYNPNPWTIVGVSGVPPSGLNTEAVAVTSPWRHGGGLVLVYLDKLGALKLERVILHELGHVLGLTHQTRGYLMSPAYSGTNQICVDKTTVEELAALKHLPLNELNWCTF